MKLGDCEGRKVAEPDFWKKFLIWRYSQKDLKIIQKSDTDIFLKNGSSDFLVFGLKLVLNMTFKKMCNLEIFDLEIVKKELPKLRFLAIFSTLHHYRWAWFLVVLQFAGPVNVFLLWLPKHVQMYQGW